MNYYSSHSFDYELKDILTLIEEVDPLFAPPLSDRVNLKKYAQKLDRLASLELAYTDDSELVGMIAFYDNDYETNRAYITFLGIKQLYQNRGIASSLLSKCISRCIETGMKDIKVRTEKHNHAAIKLYEKKGFAQKEWGSFGDQRIYLIKKLN